MMTLYIFEHCMYSVRVLFFAGLKKIDLQVEAILANDDETLTKLIGETKVPLLVKDDGSCLGESLDIVRYLDQFDGKAPLIDWENDSPILEEWIGTHIKLVNKLVFPREIEADFGEFATLEARNHLRNKVEQRDGMTMAQYRERSEEYAKDIRDLLVRDIEPRLEKNQYIAGDKLQIDDICLYPFLLKLTIAEYDVFPPSTHKYVQNLMKQSGCDLSAKP